MAAGDQGAAAPTGRGVPLWVWGAGVGAVVLFLYLRKKGSLGGSAQPGTLTPAVATDPNTGYPIDTGTGLPIITAQPNAPTSLNTWAAQAEGALVNAGYSPALAAQSLYQYQQGAPLNSAQSGAINKALSLVGFPPIPLPFLGTIPPTPGNVTPTGGFITTTAYKALSAAQRALYYPVTTSGGAHGYFPHAAPAPSGLTLGYTGAPFTLGQQITLAPNTLVGNGNRIVPAAPAPSVAA